MIVNRRELLKVGMLTGATAALAGCARTSEQAFVSEALMPEFYLPGIAQWYATTCNECSAGCGLGIRVIGGRAKKVEGIPTHPLSRGGHCVRAESALQALYNPDRLVAPWQGGAKSPDADWNGALKALTAALEGNGPALWIAGTLRGATGALITEAARRMGARIWLLDFPGTRVERAAARANGRLPWLDIASADYVVNFGSDFLGTEDNSVNFNWQYGQFRSSPTRRVRGILVSFASRMNLTVSNSDRWIPTKPGTEGFVAAAVGNLLASKHNKPGMPEFAAGITAAQAAKKSGVDEKWIHRLAEKLAEAKNPVVVGGYDNAAYTNGVWSLAVINALNKVLGGADATYEPDLVLPVKGVGGNPSSLMVSAKQALDGLKAGTYKTVMVSDCNPAYQLPAALNVGAALQKANTIVFSPYINETSGVAKWTLPTTSFLENWDDAALDGPVPVYGVTQPAAVPRPGSMQLGDVLLLAMGKKPAASMRELVCGRFMKDPNDLKSEDRSGWLEILERGGIWKDASLSWEPYPSGPSAPPPPPANRVTADPPNGVSPWEDLLAAVPSRPEDAVFDGSGEFTLLPYPSPIWEDGSLTNRPWIPEIPDPVIQVNWGSWVEINPRVAERLDIHRGDLVTVTSSAGSITLPAVPSPTVHPQLVAIPMGWGHTSFGRYAAGKGVNPMSVVTPVFQDETGEIAYAATRVTVTKTGQKGTLISYDQRYTSTAHRHLEE